MLARLVVVALLATPLVALAAGTDLPSGGKLILPPPDAPQPVTPAPAKRSLVTLRPPVASSQPDAAECRTTCAQARYQCEAAEQSEDCGAHWSQCLATCDAPELETPAPAAP